MEAHRWDEHGSHTLRAWSFTFAASPGLWKWLSIHNILNGWLLRKDLDFFGPVVILVSENVDASAQVLAVELGHSKNRDQLPPGIGALPEFFPGGAASFK